MHFLFIQVCFIFWGGGGWLFTGFSRVVIFHFFVFFVNINFNYFFLNFIAKLNLCFKEASSRNRLKNDMLCGSSMSTQI